MTLGPQSKLVMNAVQNECLATWIGFLNNISQNTEMWFSKRTGTSVWVSKDIGLAADLTYTSGSFKSPCESQANLPFPSWMYQTSKLSKRVGERARPQMQVKWILEPFIRNSCAAGEATAAQLFRMKHKHQHNQKSASFERLITFWIAPTWDELLVDLPWPDLSLQCF